MRKVKGEEGFSAPDKPMFLVASIATGGTPPGATTPFGGVLKAADGPFYSTLSNILQVSCAQGQSSDGPAWIYALAGTEVPDDALAGLTSDGGSAAPAGAEGPAEEAPPAEAEDAAPADAASVEFDESQGAVDMGTPIVDADVMAQDLKQLAAGKVLGALGVTSTPAAAAPAPAKSVSVGGMRIKMGPDGKMVLSRGGDGAAASAAPAAAAGGSSYTLKQPLRIGFASQQGGTGKQQLTLQLPKGSMQPAAAAAAAPAAAAAAPAKPRMQLPAWLQPRAAAAKPAAAAESGWRPSLVQIPRRQQQQPAAAAPGMGSINMAPGDQDSGVWEIKVVNGSTVAKLRAG
jgi:hypothetical protein